MSKGIDDLKDWAMHNVRLISILPSNNNLQVDTKLIDVLEHDVDEKYYLEKEKIKSLMAGNKESIKKGYLKIKEATKKGYSEANEGDAVNYQYPDSKTRRGRVGKQMANTLEASGVNQGIVTKDIRIRKLTVKECWRLQGFTDEQFYKAKNDGVSNSQLYKQAGNSVTVNVIDAIARKLT